MDPSLIILGWAHVLFMSALAFIAGVLILKWTLELRIYIIKNRYGLGFCGYHKKPLSKVMKKCRTFPKKFRLKLADRRFVCERDCRYWFQDRNSWRFQPQDARTDGRPPCYTPRSSGNREEPRGDDSRPSFSDHLVERSDRLARKLEHYERIYSTMSR